MENLDSSAFVLGFLNLSFDPLWLSLFFGQADSALPSASYQKLVLIS